MKISNYFFLHLLKSGKKQDRRKFETNAKLSAAVKNDWKQRINNHKYVNEHLYIVFAVVLYRIIGLGIDKYKPPFTKGEQHPDQHILSTESSKNCTALQCCLQSKPHTLRWNMLHQRKIMHKSRI